MVVKKSMNQIRHAVTRKIPDSWKRWIKTKLGRPLTVLHSDWSVLDCIGPIYRPHQILDVGAHHGWFFHCWLDWCPQAEVHAFEPFPESYEVTRGLYGSDPRVRLHPVAIGASCGHQTLNVLNGSKVSNSFLVPKRATWEAVRFDTGEITQVTVPVTTVDAYAQAHALADIFLMKVDVQGYEIKVLEGALETLPRIDHIFIEAGIKRLYENAPRFSDVFEFLTARGFHLMALRTWHRGNHVLMETDMLFRRDDLAPPVDESIERIVVQA